MNFDVLAKLPLVSENTKLVDEGNIEQVSLKEIIPAVEALKKEGE